MEKRTTVERQRYFRSLEAKSLRSRSFLTRIADGLTATSGSPVFLLCNAAVFAGWIIANIGIIPGLIPFDPFPFGLLTMAVSLEAIFLSIFVLISQNRTAYIGTIRDEVNLQINLTAEQEITKILQILAQMRKTMKIDYDDPELERMLRNIDESGIERNIAAQINRADKSLRRQLTQDFSSLFVGSAKKSIGNNVPQSPPVTVN